MDLDLDGDQDVFANMGGAYSGDVYRNALFKDPGHGNHWISLKLEGKTSNRPAIGGRIKVSATGPSGARASPDREQRRKFRREPVAAGDRPR